jgi:hypothetical protein
MLGLFVYISVRVVAFLAIFFGWLMSGRFFIFFAKNFDFDFSLGFYKNLFSRKFL